MLTVQNDDVESSLIEQTPENTQLINNPVKEPKKNFVWLLLVSGVIMYTLYGNMAIFYPVYVRTYHPSISEATVGLLIGLLDAGMFFGALISS